MTKDQFSTDFGHLLEEVTRKHLLPAYMAGAEDARNNIDRTAGRIARYDNNGGIPSVFYIHGHMDEVARLRSAS